VRRIAISGLVALAAVLGGVAVPATAMAQPATGVRPGITARPAVIPDGLGGEPLISCVLATDCLGTDGGSSLSGGFSTPTQVARWNGSTWKRVRVTLPKGTKSDDLKAVSCKGAKSCLVVGDYYTSTSETAATHALALSYNGTSLKPTSTVPLPRGTKQAAFTGVSCATAKYCVAVGVAYGDTVAFGLGLNIIETWNGARWTLHTVPAMIGKTTLLQLAVASCATTAFCVLAGDASSNTAVTDEKPYFASWNGKKLTAMKPATVGSDQLVPTAVSCATTSNCAVSGADLGNPDGSSDGFTAFTEIWNGKRWQLGTVTWPKGIVSYATSVSCYAAHSCEAVGVDGANFGASFDAAAMSFNGTAGVLQAVPTPSKGDSDLFAAVSCLPWGSCVATGETGKTTANSGAVMTGVWNGRAWKLDPGF
jgi:hypothetical protein